MSVLITGGSGFVGLNIAAALLERGGDVVLFGPDPPPAAAAAHLRSLPGRLAVAIGDVRDGSGLAEALSRHGVDRVVHGAAITAGPDRERRQARRIAEVNLVGTIEVLEAALAAGIARVVQLGTGAVHAVVPDGVERLDEVLHPPVPESLYGITKYAAERTALRYRQTRGLDVTVARLGVVFGRWEYDTGVRDTLSLPFQLAEIAEARGHARFRRGLPDDWVYATDVAEAVVRMLDAPALPSPVYQVATGGRWSIESWCDRLAGACPGFSYEAAGDGDAVTVGATAPRPRPPFSVERLRADLGFTARFREPEAFADYVAWRAEAGAPKWSRG